MKITPIDIQQQQFKGKMFGGLDQEDVDAFLQSVAAEMENLVRENNDLKEQQARQSREMVDLAEKEKELRDILLGAQRITEDMKVNARKEADLIVSEAELKAERIVADAERQLGELKARIEDVRRQKVQFEMSLKGLLDSYARQLSGDEPT
jgi:cell division initiation protein